MGVKKIDKTDGKESGKYGLYMAIMNNKQTVVLDPYQNVRQYFTHILFL